VADEARVDEETMDDGFTLLEAPLLLPQFPKPLWHPVPQYAEVLPHQPLLEQQLPNDDPRQVNPFAPPHVASVDTFFVGAGAGEDVRVDVRTTEEELDFFVDVTDPLPLHVP
jgi:hypothetical protein